MATKKTKSIGNKLTACKTFEEVLETLKIPNWWNALIVSDGSGSTWEQPAGWGWTLLVQNPFLYKRSGAGALSHGSSVFAETLSVLHPICYLESLKIQSNLEIFVITDCQIVCRWGEGSVAPKTYSNIWAGLQENTPSNFHLHWRHVPRNKIALNKLAHVLANEARILFKQQWPQIQDDTVPKFSPP